MKQTFLNFSGKKFITAIFLSAAVLLTAVSSNAAINSHNIEIISGDNSNIQFAGSTSEALLFKVHIKNAKGDNFTLTIKNDNGDVLFTKSFNDVNFQKQFKVLKGDQDSERYYFTISSANKSLEDIYAISAASRTIDDVVINKL
ncbi:MAG: hypothetical protein ABJB05_09610 [Parafilimonas sp.]